MISLQKKRLYARYAKSFVTYAFLLLFLCLFLLQAQSCMPAVQNALSMCVRSVIPSLFPFFVFADLLTQTGFVRAAGALLQPLVRPLFRISGRGALVFLIGILSGYPTGAKMTADLYREGFIDRAEGRKLLPFCNNSGPLFIIGAVGSGMFASVKIGIFLYLVHLLAALLVGLCFRFVGEKRETDALSLRTAVGSELRGYYRTRKPLSVADSVSGAVQSTLFICGFILFFSVLTESVRPMLALIPNEFLRLVFGSIPEVTSGVSGVSLTPLSLEAKCILISGLLGFGGICVHLQVLGVLSGTDLGMKHYLLGKVLHAVFAVLLCAVALFLFP